MDFELWLTFVATSIVLLLIPGPTILLVLSYSLSHGKKVALATASGVALGDFLAISASLAGLGALVLASATLFTILKLLGAAYLVYLGIKLFYTSSNKIEESKIEDAENSAFNIFTHTCAVTALNPKSIVFFIAFVPQFIVLESPLFPQFLILISTFVALGSINAFTYALLADKLRSKISKPSILSLFSRLGGSALIAMGIGTAIFKKAA